MRKDQTVIEAKRFGVLSCNQNQTLAEAVRRMVEEDVSALVVLDIDGFLAGIITRTDLLSALTKYAEWENHLVGDFMNREVVVVSPHTTLIQVAHLLVEKGIHRVVVVREEQGKQRPISVISAADLVYHMARNP
jgi:CBS domain-containing protein